MRGRTVVALLALIVVVTVGSLQATASGGKNFAASLTGYEETPTLSVAGTGSFTARLSNDGTSISYTLSYSGLSGAAGQAHIHIGMPATAGAPIAFLCGGDQAACPGDGGTVAGTIVAANVMPAAGQGIAAGEFEELVAAMRFGATYANIHTAAFPAGEIRGQIGQ